MRPDSCLTRDSSAVVRAFTALILVSLVLAWGCADFEATVDPTGGLPDVEVANPSFATDIQPIFTQRCSIGGCHSLASAQGELVLVEGHAYDSLVNKPSSLAPGFVRVEPANADTSWLVRMIEADEGARFNNARMPLGGHPLTPNQIATIVNWIENGALRN
jgi:hypothetical protein